ncbi:hypothetical protein CLV30_11027 [Haloactinopolyspora alba]|uniref:Dienelactone hydrolase domain-containing protein n=1 Tax=Haloactinopolyspora alba TaxID=648780 RepID=A0A2P8DYS9_9ACTN|nr:acyl-CoA thioester hydrolase/BAAT C-terminal domain-containing protein [Haloactinopolyspora alba]PSL02374.1 hypothetical protein CLV30_11027 [Haloactinopolyspora alba]
MKATIPGRGSRRRVAVAGASIAGIILLGVAGRLLAGSGAGWEPAPYTADPLADDPPEIAAASGSRPEAGPYDVRREETSVPVRGDDLDATVFAPDAPGEFPAVAFVHGAGGGGRESFFGLAERFARAGIVAVAYDKRSDYSYLFNRDFGQLAEDAVAVVRVMRERPDVDADRAGLWGLSEGGRVVPLAAAGAPEVGFVVTVGGAVRGPLRNTAWSVAEGLAEAGAPSGAARLAVRVLGGGTMFTLHLDPPQNVWTDVGQPALVVYGTEDFLVPPAESARGIVDDLERGGNTSYAVRFFGGAGHALRLGGDYAPGYLRTITDWITGLPGSAADGPRVAGSLPEQRFATTPILRTPWYGGTAALVITVAAALAGTAVVPRLLRRRLGTPEVRWYGVVRPVRRAARASVLAFAALWAFVGLLIGLGYTRNGVGWLFQAGWGAVRIGAVAAVVAAAVAAVSVGTARRRGWRPTPAQAGTLCSYAGVAVLMLLNVAYWGVFEPTW